MTAKVLTPTKAVRAYCLWCCRENSSETLRCARSICDFWKFRRGKGRIKLKAIRKWCLNCDGEGKLSVRNCQYDGEYGEFCPLWIYRLGKRPRSNRQGGDTNALKQARLQAKKAREAILARGQSSTIQKAKKELIK